MSRKKKPYWNMTAEELGVATKQFDEEFAADRASPMTPEMKARWERARAKDRRAVNGRTDEIIAVRVDKALLERCSALAKKKRVSRNALIVRGLRTLLAAEDK